MNTTTTVRSSYPTSPLAEYPIARGDAITGDRYWSKEFADKEWEHVWKRIWHVGGRTSQLEEPGDYIVHDFRQESVLIIKQHDGSLRAFFNVCQHRGNRLTIADEGGVTDGLSCPYHGWRWGLDGVLNYVQDPETFPQGNPCGKLKLREISCDTWGGLRFLVVRPRCQTACRIPRAHP
jgi:phenylpropionate dioxygenase-like ring-hydroxylating dioxygenase large terminal subunit